MRGTEGGGARLRRWVAVVATIAALATGASGCKTVDKSIQILDEAVAAVESMPGEWKTTMDDTIARLGQERASALSQVQDLVSSAFGQSQSAVMCTADFFGRRVHDGLQRILHNLDPNGHAAPGVVPVVCTTNPPTQVTAGTTQLVTYFGYDFVEFAKTQPFRASLAYADGTVAVADFGHVTVTHNYEIGVEFQAASYAGIDRARGPKLVLRWGDAPVGKDADKESALPVIIPAPPAPLTDVEFFTVSRHADPGVFSGYCTEIAFTYPIRGGGWVIDRSKGDYGHAGVSEIASKDNQQSRDTLRGYMYGPMNDTKVAVDGHICGSAHEGPGAIFQRTYKVFIIKYP